MDGASVLIRRPEPGHIHLLLKWGTPGRRVMTGRHDPMFVYKNASELCLWMVGEGCNGICCPEKSPLNTRRMQNRICCHFRYIPARIAAAPHIKATIDIKAMSGSR